MIPRVILGSLLFGVVALLWWNFVLIGFRGGEENLREMDEKKEQIKSLHSAISQQNQELEEFKIQDPFGAVRNIITDENAQDVQKSQAIKDAELVVESNINMKDRFSNGFNKVRSVYKDVFGKDEIPPITVDDVTIEEVSKKIEAWQRKIVWQGDVLSSPGERTLEDSINICESIKQKIRGFLSIQEGQRNIYTPKLSKCEVGLEKPPVEATAGDAINFTVGNTNPGLARQAAISSLIDKIRVVPLELEIGDLRQGDGRKLVLNLVDKEEAMVLHEMSVVKQEFEGFTDVEGTSEIPLSQEVVSMRLDYYLLSAPDNDSDVQTARNKKADYEGERSLPQNHECLLNLPPMFFDEENQQLNEVDDAQLFSPSKQKADLNLDVWRCKKLSDKQE